MVTRAPAPGNVRQVLKAIEASFPDFHKDPEMRRMALIGLAQCLGVVAGWELHLRGEEACEKGLKMVYAMAFHTATVSDSVLRSKQDPVEEALRRLAPPTN